MESGITTAANGAALPSVTGEHVKVQAPEYQNVALSLIDESPSNPRKTNICRCGCKKSEHNLKAPQGCHKCSCTWYCEQKDLNGGARRDSRGEVRSLAVVGGSR